MKKLLSFLVYAVTFSVPALIVQGYSRFVDPMSSEEQKMATITGTVAMLILAVITGFGGRKPKLPKGLKNVKMSGPGEIIVKDPGAHGAETLFKWNDKTQLWESDHGTYLDQDSMNQWMRQRGNDRAWADQQMKNLKERNTAFDRDIRSMGRKKR